MESVLSERRKSRGAALAYQQLQKCSKLAAGCVTCSKELRFASKKAAPQAASVAKILAAKLVQPDGWARGEREGYGGPCDVTSLSLSLSGG